MERIEALLKDFQRITTRNVVGSIGDWSQYAEPTVQGEVKVCKTVTLYTCFPRLDNLPQTVSEANYLSRMYVDNEDELIDLHVTQIEDAIAYFKGLTGFVRLFPSLTKYTDWETGTEHQHIRCRLAFAEVIPCE